MVLMLRLENSQHSWRRDMGKIQNTKRILRDIIKHQNGGRTVMDLNGIGKNKVLVSLIVLAVLTRLIPHPPNIAPITGIALFGGS